MKKQVMTLAWLLVRSTGLNISDSLRMSWKNFKLREEMKNKVVKFRYMKINGEERTALGTLKDTLIPSHDSSGAVRKSNALIQCYYDIDRDGWRSFRKENLIGLN